MDAPHDISQTVTSEWDNRLDKQKSYRPDSGSVHQIIIMYQHTSTLLLLICSTEGGFDNFSVADEVLPNTSVFTSAPTDKSKIKITSEELDLCNFCLLLKYIRRNVGGHAGAEYT